MGACVYWELRVYSVTLGLRDHACDVVGLFLEMLSESGF